MTIENTFEKLLVDLWLERQLKDDPAILFYVSYRTLLNDWQEFTKYDGSYIIPARYTNLKDAEERAAINSRQYEGSLVKLSVGTVTISLWEDGECIYQSNLRERFVGKDYEKFWA